MHLGNSLICPVTGIPMLIAAGVTAFYAFKQARKNFTKDKMILTVLLGIAVFLLQMLDFSIPIIEAPGHIIGAMLLAILLGPNIAFLTMSVIIALQAFLLGDGGTLAIGCNIFNMGFLACFVAYPLIYKVFANKNQTVAIILACVAALQLGAVSAYFEAYLSGTITVSLSAFLSAFQCSHFAIGIAEGIFTALTVAIVEKSNILQKS